MTKRGPILAGALLVLVAGCRTEPLVVRSYNGRLVVERFVPPDAYAAFLRGALAEASGDLKGALAAYDDATSEDEGDPEIWSRLGAVRCAINPKDREADRAFGRAAAVDPTYAGMLVARSRWMSASP